MATGTNTRVQHCTCQDSFQDGRHGKGMRVHNRTKQNKSDAERRWRCTSCGKES